jgi:hypothetical protein
MTWASLNLWADEERRIHQCLTEALQQLIAKRVVFLAHEEKPITGLLRPILKRVCKNKKLDWTLHPEAASFAQEDDPEPIAYPDIRFSRLDTVEFHISPSICIGMPMISFFLIYGLTFDNHK